MMTEDAMRSPQIRTMTSPDGQRQMTITSIPVERDLRKKNVAAYARVSTLTENQAESFETQVEFYTTYISKNNDWNYVGIYADNGISGLSVKKRPEFLRMIDDAMNGKIDIILVKSISRFARNCLEAQTYVHQLKEKNVEVIFEKEGVSSFNPQTDLIFNFMAAIAQEESRSISENVRWTYKKLAEQGIRHLGNNRVLGYDEIKGELVPNDDAWIIQQIFEDFVAGFTLREIAKRVNEKGGKTLRKKGDFTPGGINHLLHNEIYVGDRLLQKKPPKDYLTKKHIEGEYESYYVENAHTPIISRELWEKAKARQEAMMKKIELYGAGGTSGTFMYGRIICGECGQPMIRRTLTYKSGVKVKAWQCRTKLKAAGCRVRSYKEEALFKAIADAAGISCDGIITPEMLDVVKEVKVYDNHRIEVTLVEKE